MEKFKLHYTPGGYIKITWKEIEVACGRPWIKDKDKEGYSELVLYLWDNRDDVEVVQTILTDSLDG